MQVNYSQNECVNIYSCLNPVTDLALKLPQQIPMLNTWEDYLQLMNTLEYYEVESTWQLNVVVLPSSSDVIGLKLFPQAMMMMIGCWLKVHNEIISFVPFSDGIF